jgi:hypothetical protein
VKVIQTYDRFALRVGCHRRIIYDPYQRSA